ncbi:MAG: hypothetical protein H6551_05200 [Chitinophagales bacterium]|nr:hypothetical protein [Chitinophagaceae bacterium]MCB9064525.1 hypothetical protein [Chitinophagales bacterium]
MSLLEQHEEENGIKLNDTGKYFILGASRWMKFFAIFMIIILSLMLLVALMMGAALSQMASVYNEGASTIAMGGASFGVGTVIFAALLYVYPIYALLKFANISKRGIHTGDSELFNDAFRYLKGFFQYMGILIIIFIGIYLVFFIAIGFGAAIGGAM